MISGLKLEIAILKRDKYGRSAERTARLIDQLELQLEELETTAAEDAIRAEQAAEKTKVAGFERRKPVKKPFPEHLPRERVVVEAPSTCACCGSDRIAKMGEDSEPLRRHVFESGAASVEGRSRRSASRPSWRHCEKISQPDGRRFEPDSAGLGGSEPRWP